MIDRENIVEALSILKYFKFRYNDKWFVYEALPEEGGSQEKAS